MTNTITVPVDDMSLGLMLEAMNTAYDCDEDGNHVLVGGTITMNQLLNFWSGYDKTQEVDESDNMSVYPHPVLHRDDIIRALIEEVRTLRARADA